MPEPRKENRWLFWTVAGIAAVALVPLYVLSSGPAFWLYRKQVISWDAYLLWTEPIHLATDQNETLYFYISRYIEWWQP